MSEGPAAPAEPAPAHGEPAETIAALATPSGRGAIGIVRLSGPRALEISGALLGRPPEALPDRRFVHALARDGDGDVIDDVLVVAMRGPHSYTGEDVVELHGHGGVLNMARLLRAVLALGARPAAPGEFTRRAFSAGRLDLTRAEAVMALIEAGSERAWKVARSQLDGALGDRIGALRGTAVELIAEIEASLDFPEEGLELRPLAALGDAAGQLAAEVRELAGTFALGQALQQGVSVALVGPVNSGKSSIFNMLLGSERAVVASEPGTTRDFVEAQVVWDGIVVTLVDTAGERETEGEAERRGIELGRRRAESADLRVVLHEAQEANDTSAPLTLPSRAESGPGAIHIVSKGDRLTAAPTGALVTSARTGQGLDELRQAILAAAVGTALEEETGIVVTSERHRALLERAGSAFAAACAAAATLPAELVAEDLRAGSRALAEITGEDVGEDVLDALFARFCIGK